MTTQITLLAEAHDALVEALAATSDETVVFGLASRVRTATNLGVIVSELEIVPLGAYAERNGGRFRLHPAYVAEVALRAVARDRTLVIVHSHPGGRARPQFSPIDERMHSMLVPALLRQLRGPIASLVWSPGGWSGLLWDDDRGAHIVDRLRIVGQRLAVVSTREADAPLDPRFDRQIRAFGRPVQQALAALRVGIVGLGGTGSLAAEWLAHMGVREFVLVDPDRLETSNLSRVVGSGPADVERAQPTAKVASARRLIAGIAPDARVDAIDDDVVHCEALRGVATCDVVLSCTDSHASRAALNALAYQYAIPLLDVGVLLRGDDGAVAGAWVDVRRAGPGIACLRCQDAIDSARVTDELLSPDERARLAAFGYAPGLRMPDPSVLPLNALGVSLLCLRLLDLLVPWLAWTDRVTVEARALEVVQRVTRSRAGCEICSASALIGRGDDVPMRCVGSTPQTASPAT